MMMMMMMIQRTHETYIQKVRVGTE